MSSISQEQILAALRKINDPDLNRDIVSLGFIKNLSINDGDVRFDINLTTPACPVKDQMQKEAQDLVRSLPGVKTVDVKMTAVVRPGLTNDKKTIDGIKNVIAIASGKGGVGKSTVTVNLAVATALTGAKVGLLDADIYGPTIPLMMGKEAQIDIAPNNDIMPAQAHGVKFMSMGFLAPGDKPLIWRGPMAHQALSQTLFQTKWGELDYLFIDLPPGTGDVHLTLVQSLALSGAVIVSTPQDVGLTIALKTYRMFETTHVRTLGLIENMSYYVCSHCGERDDIFGNGGAETSASQLGIPFLGAIPLERKIREQSDYGRPIVAAFPESDVARRYREIATKVAAQVSIASFAQETVAP
jgi:ATP-binding protein involved in chromosome partitioning